MTGGKSMRRSWSPFDLERTISNVERRERVTSAPVVRQEKTEEKKDNRKRIDDLFGD